jgi:hypothetical protein
MEPAAPQLAILARPAEGVEVLRWGLEWLERGEQVVVNLRPETEEETEVGVSQLAGS